MKEDDSRASADKGWSAAGVEVIGPQWEPPRVHGRLL